LAGVDVVLNTGRLVLRPVAAGDHAGCWRTGPTRTCGGSSSTGRLCRRRTSREAIAGSTATFEAAGYGLWLIHQAGDSELAGVAGLRRR
jgi:hypothetical protein